MKTKIFLSLILTVFLFTLTGCYDANTIEDYYYIVAMGIDLAETEGMYNISIQIAKNKSSSDSGSGSSQSSSYSIYSVEAETINGGINILNNYLDKQINISHCSAIIFSEELARQGIGHLLNALANNRELRPNSFVLISNQKAYDVLDKVSNAGENFSSRFYEYIVNSLDYTGYAEKTTFEMLLSDSNNKYGDGIAIYTSVGKDYIQNEGLAVFKDDRMVGHTTAVESIAYLLLVNHLEESMITIDNPFEENSKIDIGIGTTKNCHKNVEIINNTPYITCDVFITANIESSGKNFDYTKSENIRIIEEETKKYLTGLLENYLYKLSREYNSDILKFKNIYTKKCLTNQDLDKVHFDEIYKDSVFKVNVDVQISSTHLFEKE